MSFGDHEEDILIYGHTLSKSRCITAVSGDENNHKFMVGTGCLHQDNYLHLFEYSSEKQEFSKVNIFPHKHEIWNLSTNPSDESLFFCVYNQSKQFKGTLYKIEESEDEKLIISPQFTFFENDEGSSKEKFPGDLQTVMWDNSGNCITVDSHSLQEWDVTKQKQISTLDTVDNRKITCSRRDPNFFNNVGYGAHTSVSIFDKRQKSTESAINIRNAHEFGVRDLDFNPIDFHVVVTGGEDCLIKFWDLRQTKKEMMSICAHSHWVVQTRFNPLKDQLLLSASTDGLVKLWNCESVSSLRKEKKRKLNDRMVTSIKVYESVYSLAWSAFDSWVFATVSFNGSVGIHTVPFSEKDAILSGSLDD